MTFRYPGNSVIGGKWAATVKNERCIRPTLRRVLERTTLTWLRSIRTGTTLSACKDAADEPRYAAGIFDRLWGMEDVVALIDERAEAPAKRGPYN